MRAADVVYSNLRGDQPAKLRLTYDDLKDVNPRIVCCSLSGFGMTGPRAAAGRLRLHDAGARRLDEPDRRPGRAADEERAVAGRPLGRVRVGDRGAGRALARPARRRRLRLRRLAVRHGAARADVRRHMGGVARVRAAAAAQLGAPVDRPVPELRDCRRLDRRRVPEGEVLGAPVRRDRATRAGGGVLDLRRSRPAPRRARSRSSKTSSGRGRAPSGSRFSARQAFRPRRSTTSPMRSRTRGWSSTSIRGSAACARSPRRCGCRTPSRRRGRRRRAASTRSPCWWSCAATGGAGTRAGGGRRVRRTERKEANAEAGVST